MRTAVNFGLKSVSPELGRGFVGGMLRISEKDRILEQKIDIPNLSGQILKYSDFNLAGVGGARDVANAVLRKFESIFETCRQHIIKNVSKPVKEKVLSEIHRRFGKLSFATTTHLLKNINWKFLFSPDHYDEDFVNVVNFSLTNNDTRSSTLLDGPNDIPVFVNEIVNKDSVSLADMRAETLLKNVIGDEEFEFFKKHNFIRLESFGYNFRIAPHQWVRCVDRNGKTASLCIHTNGFSCNKIDECIISYLHLKNELTFMEFMRTAIVQRSDEGFVLLPELSLA